VATTLHRIHAQNFLSLRDVDVQLGPLNVLVGPNGAGKSNLLKVVRFLGATARAPIPDVINAYGGWSDLLFRGGNKSPKSITLGIEAQVTQHSSATALDVYELEMTRLRMRRPRGEKKDVFIVRRSETLKFKRTRGRGRRITTNGSMYEVDGQRRKRTVIPDEITALNALRYNRGSVGSQQIETIASLLESFSVLDVDVKRARMPSQVTPSAPPVGLASDASNLAAWLLWLLDNHPDICDALERDLRTVVPGFSELSFTERGPTGPVASVAYTENGLRGETPLLRASFGTVRAIALLAALHDPRPSRIICIEEIDHGIHPHALDTIVYRMREASKRTQVVVATHSPALVNRLDPTELIVCERNERGESIIPAIDARVVREMSKASDLLPGELWFSGVLGGCPA